MLVNENGSISLPGKAHFSGRSGAYGSKNGQSMVAKGEHFQRRVFLRGLLVIMFSKVKRLEACWNDIGQCG
jgi:hypothetical protein